MALSKVGRKKVAVHVVLWLLNAVVLALSAKINVFQEFFFIADLFPFALSIATAVILGAMIILDFAMTGSYTGRPQFEIGVFAVFAVFWLAFNAFSTVRWKGVTMQCGGIPAEFPDVREWCKEVQALKAFVWVEFLMFFFTCLTTLRYSITQNARGNKHIFKMPLSRYSPVIRHGQMESINFARDSEFLQYEKM